MTKQVFRTLNKISEILRVIRFRVLIGFDIRVIIVIIDYLFLTTEILNFLFSFNPFSFSNCSINLTPI